MVISTLAEKMARVSTTGQVVKFTRASSETTSVLAREHYTILMAKYLSALGKRARSTAKVTISGQTAPNTTSCTQRAKSGRNLANSKAPKFRLKI